MRNRSNYNFTPAQGDVLYIQQQQAAARRPAMTVNYDRLLLLLFFAVVPLMWIITWIWTPFLWVLFLTIVATLVLLWLKKGFTARGRLIMTSAYAVFSVLALTGALRGGQSGLMLAANNNFANTVAPINFTAMLTTPGPQATVGGTGADPLGSAFDAPGDAGGGQIVDTTQGAALGTSACEQVLVQFLEAWKTNLVSNMVPLTPPSWRAKIGAAANGVEQKLYWQLHGKELKDYRFDTPTAGTDNDTSRTVNLLTKINIKEKEALYRLTAIMLQESGAWYVDPPSLTFTLAESATPAPDQELSPTPTPTEAPTKAPSKKTKLYYNKKGGKYYHATSDCAAVAKEYLPLKSFTYGDLKKTPFDKLQPCGTCGAPPRSTE